MKEKIINHYLAGLELENNEMVNCHKILCYEILIMSLSGMLGKGYCIFQSYLCTISE